MIKIASITPYKILPAVTGGQKGIFFFLKYLARHAELTAFTVAENNGTVDGIVFKPLLGSTTEKLRYINPILFFRIKSECRKRGLRYIIIEHPYYAWLGFALKKWGGLKVVFHSHNIEAERFRTMHKWWWKWMYRYERFAHRLADFNFFISREDKDFAVSKYGVNEAATSVITYGIEASHAPTVEDRKACREQLCKELGLPAQTKLILFNGTLDYAPNRAGLDSILHEINPLLQKLYGQPYTIVICGLRLPVEYEDLKTYASKNIVYKGFVTDINLYFKAADLFINPITDGGGIKTKLVEALAANTPAVSFAAGAYGIPVEITGRQLAIVKDGDHKAFAAAVINQLDREKDSIPAAFFEHFSWESIALKAANILNRL